VELGWGGELEKGAAHMNFLRELEDLVHDVRQLQDELDDLPSATSAHVRLFVLRRAKLTAQKIVLEIDAAILEIEKTHLYEAVEQSPQPESKERE
jgi:hypothetical protein